MSRARSLRSKARKVRASLVTRYEYARARSSFPSRVASALPDHDEGVHIGGSKSETDEDHIRGPKYGWKNRSKSPDGNPVVKNFGRRRTDLKADHIITKKLVVVTVILVDALYLAGDALLNGAEICP